MLGVGPLSPGPRCVRKLLNMGWAPRFGSRRPRAWAPRCRALKICAWSSFASYDGVGRRHNPHLATQKQQKKLTNQPRSTTVWKNPGEVDKRGADARRGSQSMFPAVAPPQNLFCGVLSSFPLGCRNPSGRRAHGACLPPP